MGLQAQLVGAEGEKQGRAGGRIGSAGEGRRHAGARLRMAVSPKILDTSYMNQNHLPTYEISHKRFTYVASDRCFVAEASDIPNEILMALHRPLYADACDVGFTLIGKHQNIRFCYEGEVRDVENEVVGWRWVACNERETPESLRDIRIRIYND